MFGKVLIPLVKTELIRQFLRQFSTKNQQIQKWDLITALCLERKPVITRPPNQLETEYKNLLSQIEFERSLKSDFELRHEKEVKQIEIMKTGADVDIHIKQTAQELVDASAEELAQFKFASATTEADTTDDVKSLERKLDKHLVLVVKQQIGKDEFFLLPQDLRRDGETLRQTAERILKDTCGPDLSAQIYGNAPFGFYKYKYPNNLRSGSSSVGAKVFIYFARYQSGDLHKKYLDFKWLDRGELDNVLPGQYKNSVQQMLVDE